jgi:hypothetical protein
MTQLTPEFYQHVAIGTVLIILFILLLRPGKKKNENDISSYFAFLKAGIICSQNKKQLGHYKIQAEKFYDKYYGKVSIQVVKRYYASLLESISQKETQLNEAAKKVPSGAL